MQVKTIVVTFGTTLMVTVVIVSNAALLTRLWELRRSAATTTGTIVAVDANKHNRATYRYRVDGVDYTDSQQATPHREGDTVDVYYSPVHPWISTLANPAEAFRENVIGTVLICAFFVIGGAVAALRSR